MPEDHVPPTDPSQDLASVPDPSRSALLGRRKALGLLAGAGVTALAVAACRGGSGSGSGTATAGAGGTTSTLGPSSSTSTTAASSTAASSTTTEAPTTTTAASSGATGTPIGAIPQETGGPYPADGTNGPNVLTQSGVVRGDIRGSFGSASGSADGVPLTIELTVVDHTTGAALPGAAVYLWHCDRQGRYSVYSQGVTGANFLRGVQAAEADGVLRFTSIFPGAYSGRWPHIHFEVFSNQASATTGRNAIRTSQLALPAAVCQQVYASSGYESSAQNMASSSLATDNVFSDGVDLQLATVTGSVAGGYTASLVVGI